MRQSLDEGTMLMGVLPGRAVIGAKDHFYLVLRRSSDQTVCVLDLSTETLVDGTPVREVRTAEVGDLERSTQVYEASNTGTTASEMADRPYVPAGFLETKGFRPYMGQDHGAR